jgi:tetratricopeptide (TPR) repeat protein
MGGCAMKLETILAFIFGLIFCGILAYAGFQTEPIPDQQFFFLRVLSALSAAGVAAVIPGFLHLQFSQAGAWSVRAGGALAVFALIFLVNPPTLTGAVTESKEAAMISNYSQGLYEDALRNAEEILEIDPNNAEAWNVKGGVAFYRQDYKTAVAFFKKAVEQKPQSKFYKNNLAYAYIEQGFIDKSIELLKSIEDEKEDWEFSIGRAYIYSGDFADAKKHLEGVSSDYLHGAARVLEAAALSGLYENSRDENEKTSLLAEARDKLKAGYKIDSVYWDRIFSVGYDKHLGYSEPLKILNRVGLIKSQRISD